MQFSTGNFELGMTPIVSSFFMQPGFMLFLRRAFPVVIELPEIHDLRKYIELRSLDPASHSQHPTVASGT